MRSAKQNTLITFILGLLATVSPFSIDMYLPAFQKVADHFHTNSTRVSFSLASYFVGLALGQVFYGPLLDRYGRKRPMYFGMALYCLSSLGCVTAHSVEGLIVARLFQALGGCALQVAAIAMVSDFFAADQAAKVFSRLMLILSVSPLFAPTVGGWIVSLWGWEAIFITLIVVVAVIFMTVFWWLPEGHQPDPTISLNPGEIGRTFREIFKNPIFFAYSLAGAFSFAGLFVYVAGAPSMFFGTFHLSERAFGLVFAALSIGMVGGGQFNIFLMKFLTSEKIFKTSLLWQMLLAMVFAVASWLGPHNLAAHLTTLFFYIAFVGLVYPNATALALAPFHKNAGSASALLGTFQMGVGAVATAIFGFIKLSPSAAMAVVFVVTGVIGVIIFQSTLRGDAKLSA